jgi:pyruvate dehydrogenase phosphatase
LGNLEPTRAFGDASYKWSRDIQDKIKKSFFGRTPHNLLKTPPYVTAEPVVTSTSIEPARGDFLVMATDGLWEMLTNEEVVGLVGQWIENQNKLASNKTGSANSTSAWLTSWFKSSNSAGSLPVEKGGNMDKTGRIDNSHQHAPGINKAGESLPNSHAAPEKPIRQQQWDTPSASSRFVVEDKNCATHLIRNALGGKDKDMVCALLTLPSPYSRRYRDDLTVQVIFFGEGGEASEGSGGRVLVNEEASAVAKKEGGATAEGGMKAKL